MLSIFDVVILISISGFVFYGVFFGFIRTVGSFFGLFIGAWLAGQYYLDFYEYLPAALAKYDDIAKVVSFMFVFGVASKAVALIFYLVDKAFKIVSIIPFISTFNRLLGALLGFVVGVLSVGLTMFVATRYVPTSSFLGKWMVASHFTPILANIGNLMSPLLPEMLNALKAIV